MLEIKGNEFYLNGEPFRILSGAVHYFRIPRERWADSINKARLLGLNTIETYVPWNGHEPEKGQYCFEGMYDLCAFIEEVQAAGMYAIVRPSPFICAEWDFGGLPYWLLQEENLELRCMNDTYLRAVESWYQKLIPMLAPYTMENGGNIIAVQIENEYGSYGCDRDYTCWLRDKMQELGFKNMFFFTSDGYSDSLLQGGTVSGSLITANFGSRAEAAREVVRRYQPTGPFMCTEFWCGWFSHWGGEDKRKGRSNEECVQELDKLLQIGGSVNLYMFHGGTSFGFRAGANFDENEQMYQPDVSSYDYGAPLTQAGDITEKYLLMRETFRKYTTVPDEPLPAPSVKKKYADAVCSGAVSLFDSLDTIGEKHSSVQVHPMEYYHQDCGYILYRTHVTGPRPELPIHLQEIHDRANVFLNQKRVGICDRMEHQKLTAEIPQGGAVLDVLAENLGRINYGPRLKEYKGITEGIRLGLQFQYGYDIYTLPMNNLEKLKFGSYQAYENPAFYRFLVETEECADTYLDMRKWGKGFVTLNGFNLGRYWNVGPEGGLFIPKEFWKKGTNELIVFEESKGRETLEFSEDYVIIGE